MSKWLTSRDPEPVEGSAVENEAGVQWVREDGAYGGPGKSNWLPVRSDGAADYTPGCAETWVKVAGNYGPVRVTP